MPVSGVSFRVGNAEIKIHPLSALSAAALLFAENSVYAFAVLFCAALHEGGHIAVLYLCGGRVLRLSFLPCGMEIYMSPLSYKKEILTALAGPAANLFSSALFYAAAHGDTFFLFCADCGVFLALFNLLPLCGFDGAQILKNLSFLYLPYEKALKLQSVSEPISLILFAAASGTVCAFAGFNLSLCVIFLYFFACAFCRR